MKKEFHYTVETSKSFEVAVQAIEQKTAEKVSVYCTLTTLPPRSRKRAFPETR